MAGEWQTSPALNRSRAVRAELASTELNLELRSIEVIEFRFRPAVLVVG